MIDYYYMFGMNKKDTQPVAVSDDEFDNDANDPNDPNDPKHWRDQRIITWDRRGILDAFDL